MLVKLASLQAFAKPLPKECSWARVSNRAFPRTDMGATPAFEGWGGPSRILRAMGSTGIGIRAQMRLKRQKPVKGIIIIKAFSSFWPCTCRASCCLRAHAAGRRERLLCIVDLFAHLALIAAALARYNSTHWTCQQSLNQRPHRCSKARGGKKHLIL